MSKNNNNLINTNRTKNIKDNKILNENIASNIIFYCDQCQEIPLIIPSNKNDKMIKYCKLKKMSEIISPCNLLNMINIKNVNINKKDNLQINDKLNFDEFICPLHGKEFINYCNDCNKDICYSCSREHFRHNLIHFAKLLPSNRDIREGTKILSEMKKDLEKFKNNSKEIIKACGSLIYLKEIILKASNSINFNKLNFNSIMNYNNILKLKIKLNEKQYDIINPFSEINSNILQFINYNFQKEIKDFNRKNNPDFLKNANNFQKNNEELYNKYLKVLEDTFVFNNDKIFESSKNNSKIIYNAFNAINNSNINNTIQQHDNHSIKFLNLGLNNSFSNFLETTENKQNNNFEQYKDNIKLNERNNFMHELNPNISEFEKSTIMNNMETNFLINLISSKMNKKIKKLYLCYKATKDGDKANNFHQKCDYIKNIIILIQTKENKKFGGFSSESWDNNNNLMWKKDEYAFIFSLNNRNSYNIINSEMALICNKKYGPIFGNGEIFISDNFFTFPSACLEKNISYESNDNSYPLNGEKEFYVTQMEAYKVDFE